MPDYLVACSEMDAFDAKTLIAPFVPLSDGGPHPHLPSVSKGSTTCTPPSVKPRANWFGSMGCAAMTRGYTEPLAPGAKYTEGANLHRGRRFSASNTPTEPSQKLA